MTRTQRQIQALDATENYCAAMSRAKRADDDMRSDPDNAAYWASVKTDALNAADVAKREIPAPWLVVFDAELASVEMVKAAE